MSEVRILLRWILLITAGLVLTTCSASKSGVAPSGDGGRQLANPCSSGKGKADRNAPIICVDDTAATLSVSPDSVTVHSVGATDRQPVMIHWWTRSGSKELSLEIQPGCVTDLTCRGGHCMARTLPVKERTRCKYDVWTDKHPRLDPDIVVDPCC